MDPPKWIYRHAVPINVDGWTNSAARTVRMDGLRDGWMDMDGLEWMFVCLCDCLRHLNVPMDLDEGMQCDWKGRIKKGRPSMAIFLMRCRCVQPFVRSLSITTL